MSIPEDDRGLLLGDGLFETVLARTGELVNWDAHVARLVRGCAVIGLPAPDPNQLGGAATEALTAAGLDQTRAAVRLSWSAGSGGRGLDRPEAPVPRLIVSASPAPAPVGPAVLVVSSVRRNDASPTSRIKSLSYLDAVLARREARATGADEAVMLNTRGELASAAAANLFWIEGRSLFTPALECGVLDGTVRAALIERARAAGIETHEVRAGADALDRAEAVMLSNSLIGLRPVARLGGRDLTPHPMAERLAELVGDLA